MPATLSTILFIDDIPVGYEVSRQGESVLFTPTRFSEKACCPPKFLAHKQAGGYVFPDTLTDDVRTQAAQTLHQWQAGKLLE